MLHHFLVADADGTLDPEPFEKFDPFRIWLEVHNPVNVHPKDVH